MGMITFMKDERLLEQERINELYDKAISAMKKYAGKDASLNNDILTDNTWTKIDWDKFRLDSSVGIDIDKFFEYYGLEDHYFYLACVKGFGTPMKIKIHIDPCSSIDIVSSTGFGGTIWPWELEERLFYIRLLPDMPEDFEWRLNLKED